MAGASRAVPTDRTFEDLRSFPSTLTRSTLRLGYGLFTPWGTLSHDVYARGRTL